MKKVKKNKNKLEEKSKISLPFKKLIKMMFPKRLKGKEYITK